MVDRPQRQHVFQTPKSMLYFDQVLVPGHGIQHGHVLLAGGNHVATFQTLFVRETPWVFAETKRPIAEFPCIIAITVMGPQRPLGCRTNCCRLLQGATRHTLLHLLQAFARAGHGLLPFALFVLPPLLGINDEHALLLIPRGDFLHTRRQRLLAFAGVDPSWAVLPLRLIDALQPGVDLSIPPPPQAHQIAVAVAPQLVQVLFTDHAAVAHEDHPADAKTFRQVADRFRHGRHVQGVARPHVVGNRPTGHHHQTHDHLDVLRFAIATVAVLGKALGTAAFEVGAGDVVQHHFGLQTEQVAQTPEQGHFDPALGCDQPIERAIPGLELLAVDTDAAVPLPAWHEATAQTNADEVGLQPAGQAVLAAGPAESISHQHEDTIGVGDLRRVFAWPGSAQVLVQDLPQAQLIEESAQDQGGPPRPALQDIDVDSFASDAGCAAQDPFQFGEELLQEILAAEIGDDALFDLTVLAIGFDDADVLVDGAVGGGDFDGADVHGDSITTGKPIVKAKSTILRTSMQSECHYVLTGRAAPARSKPRKKRGIL